MDVPYFRPEATEEAAGRWAGNTVLVHPITVMAAATVAAILLALLILFMTTGEYTRKARVSGTILPDRGTVTVAAPGLPTARVLSRFVSDGQKVRRGQALFELASERGGSEAFDSHISSLLVQRASAVRLAGAVQVDELRQRERSIMQRIRVAEHEVSSRKQEVHLQLTAIKAARERLAGYKRLASKGFISRAQLDQANVEVNAQLARKTALESNVLSVHRDLLALQEEAASLHSRIELIEQETGSVLTGVELESAEHQSRSRVQIVAPEDGIVTALANTGEAVTPGTPLAAIIPAGSRLLAELAVPSRALGFIRHQQEVRLRVDAYPYQKFGQVRGRVALVERSPRGNDGAQPLYRVSVHLDDQGTVVDGQAKEFQAGMRVEADVLLETRSLLEWLMDPLVSSTSG